MATVAVLVLSEIGAATTLSTPTKQMFKQAASWMPSDWLASYIHFLGWPPIAYLVSGELLGESPTLLSALSWCRDRWRSWLAISGVLWGVCSLLPYAVHHVMSVIGIDSWVGLHWGFGPTSPPGSFLFALLQWAFDSFFILAVALGASLWSVERAGVATSLHRNWTLAKGRWVGILTAELVRDVLGFVLVGSLTVIFGVVLGLALRNHEAGELLYRIRFKFIVVVAPTVSALVGPILPIALTLFYYDQRIRHEGFDIERMMDAAGLNPLATPQPTGDEPASPAAEEAHA